jgi:hypothetical protein
LWLWLGGEKKTELQKEDFQLGRETSFGGGFDPCRFARKA